MSGDEDVEIPADVLSEVRAIESTLGGSWHVTGVLDQQRSGDTLSISVAACSGDQCELRHYTVTALGNGEFKVEAVKKKR
jgi:hypothetical protein